MTKHDDLLGIDRRAFLGTGALTLGALTSWPSAAWAQQALAGEAGAQPATRVVAGVIASFGLKDAAPGGIARGGVGFIDTMGVMLAGSREEVAHLVVDMVKLEGATQ